MRFFRKIKHIIKWLPILWDDADWDHYYLLKILRFKLAEMLKYFHNFEYVETEEYEKQMKRCLHLIDRLQRDDYWLVAKRLGYTKKAHLDKTNEMMVKDSNELFSIIDKNWAFWWV